MLRVMHVLAPAAFGGLERVVHALALGQLERGHHVQVVALLDARRSLPYSIERMQSVGLPTHPVASPPRAYFRQATTLVDLCRSFHPHVVHTHGYLPDVLAGLMARRLTAGLVSTAHGFTGVGWKNQLYEWMQRRAYRRFD